MMLELYWRIVMVVVSPMIVVLFDLIPYLALLPTISPLRGFPPNHESVVYKNSWSLSHGKHRSRSLSGGPKRPRTPDLGSPPHCGPSGGCSRYRRGGRGRAPWSVSRPRSSSMTVFLSNSCGFLCLLLLPSWLMMMMLLRLKCVDVPIW